MNHPAPDPPSRESRSRLPHHLGASLLVLLLAGCQTSAPPEFGMVDWFVANGTGNAMTLTIYDKVCGRNHYRVRIARSSETRMSTCANEAGNAEIRYSRTAGYSVSANPIRHDVISSNQSLLVD